LGAKSGGLQDRSPPVGPEAKLWHGVWVMSPPEAEDLEAR